MNFIPQIIKDVILIKPNVHKDDRGYFFESFRQDLFDQAIGYKINFIQDNVSMSKRGVLRGLHYQLNPYSQAKLIRVVKGTILDVAVDIRMDSSTFGNHVAIKLSCENKHQLFIPQGFAHGFVVLSDSATVSYKTDNFYAPKYEKGIRYDDDSLLIDWQLNHDELLINEKDKNLPSIKSI